MAKGKRTGGGAGDGSKVPSESAVLDGEIVTAAKSTMEARSYERGYPDPEGSLHMAGLVSRKQEKK